MEIARLNRLNKIISTLMVGAVLFLAIMGVQSLPVVTEEVVKVAILDSGSNTAYREGISLIGDSVKDENGHGTLMAKIIRKYSSYVDFYIVKVADKEGQVNSEEAIILGLKWAISRDVDIISMSLRLKHSEKLHKVIRKAYKMGIVMFAAAGNDDSPLDYRHPSYKIAYPAKYPEVIAVGMLEARTVAGPSRRGQEIALLCKGYEGRKFGTSISTATAVGLAAEIISKYRDHDCKKIKNIIVQKVGAFKAAGSVICGGTGSGS